MLESRDPAGWHELAKAFDSLFVSPDTVPLTAEWIAQYRDRRAKALPSPEVAAERPLEIPSPHSIQKEALQALRETRAAAFGQRAGLVVLATGLGKTWLSAFDSHRPEFRRVLFVAHREEILQPVPGHLPADPARARLGLYMGQEREAGRRRPLRVDPDPGPRRHLSASRATFDYIVVDEFHHAAAPTYRRLIDYFRPKFLLGLTATPERTDGGDLLALCQENLVYRCDFVDGIRRRISCAPSTISACRTRWTTRTSPGATPASTRRS